MIRQAFQGTVDYMQILDKSGNVDVTLLPVTLDGQKAVDMYMMMCFARAFDAKALSLQRQGRAVTYAPSLGQEATQVGSVMAMRSDDIIVPNFRQHAVYIARGMPLHLLFLYWRGFEEGSAIPKQINCLPEIVPVGTQVPHAAGIAFAHKYNKTGRAALCYVGDGGTSEGDFYEAINFAGVFKLPLIVIIENNQWAISLPRSQQSAAPTLAQKAIAAGIKGVQVDGNDAFAVYKATTDAMKDMANGPTVIECLTYRMGMHTTSDDPTKYRDDAQVKEWQDKDPLTRLKRYLMNQNLWDEAKQTTMELAQSKQIDDAVEKAEQFKPDPKSMFENIYSFMPEVLKQQYDEALKNNFWQ